MFADRRVAVMVPAKDVERATKFYEGTLGLKGEAGEFGIMYPLTGGTPMFIYQSAFAGTSGATLLTFDTKDLASDMTALRGKGVKFEEYDLPELKTVDGVAEFGPMKTAWFKDTEGNIIAVAQGM